MRWILLGLAFVLLPFVVYLLSKAATWGRLKATHEFTEIYFHQHTKQKQEQEENNHGKEKRK